MRLLLFPTSIFVQCADLEHCISSCQDDMLMKDRLMIRHLSKFYQWTNVRRWRSWLERSPCKRKVRCSNPSRDRPKSRVLGDDHYKRMPVSQLCGTLKNSHFSMAISAEHRSKFATLHRRWWCLQMSENSRVGWKTPNKQTNKINKQG